ncbi:hypothetical protein HID58_076445 [Brassica napus]|uniref:Pentatricopeptide repeat-containing protein n=1 Tax=Brassica napus TaxID=3708 RepID=A0ABQ7YMS5_BRANA|nr:hypothetical protein HID58_076445 [Brassica napus]
MGKCKNSANVFQNLSKGATLIHRLGFGRRPRLAVEVFDLLPDDQKGVAAYTALMDVYISAGSPEKAMKIFEEMREFEIMPSLGTYNALLSGLEKTSDFHREAASLKKEKKKRERASLPSTSVVPLMTTALTGVSSPEPPDPPDPPDLTSAFTIPSTFVIFTISNLDLKIQIFRKMDLNSQIFKETFFPKDFGLTCLIVVFIRPFTEAHPSLTFTMSVTTGSRSQPSLQVIDLKLYVSILLASMISFECSLVPCSGKLASVRLSAYDCLPYLPFGLSGRVAGSSAPKIMYASMFVLLKGSSIWCFVASACDAELLIVKSASVAVSITGVRPVLVLSNSQSLSTVLSTIGVEFRGLLGDISCCLCVIVAPILWCYIILLCFAIVAADVLAGLALLLYDVKNFSSYGD